MVNKRAKFLLIVFTLLFVTLIGYITYIEESFSPEYTASDYNARKREQDINTLRGTIYSSDNQTLAYSVEENGNVVRKYPFDNLYSHVIGYVNKDYSSRTLVESGYNSQLLGTGNMNDITNIKNQIKYNRARGNDLTLTINHELQKVADEAIGDYKGAIVALSPKTGEIYAMISKPDYDPNTDVLPDKISTLPDGTLLARAFNCTYPPGSTFKTVTTASVIENGLENETYNDKTGTYTIKSADGNPENDYTCSNEEAKYRYGLTDLEKAFTVSSNVYFAHLSTMLSSEEIRTTAENFMFNKELPFDLPVIKSNFQSGKLTDAEKIMASIGQGKTEASPLHMALIAATVANDGIMPRPYIVKNIYNDNITEFEAKPSDLGRIIPESTAQKIKDMMLAVVKSGTGTKAQISGIEVCGKTGTSENATTASEDGNSDKTHALFIGFAPYDDPEIAVCVILEEAGFGGEKAAPVAKTVIEQFLKLNP